MPEHVHINTTLHWGRVLMTHHLAREHGLTVPMTWNNGMLQQKHLEAHTVTQAKEKTMTQTVDTDDLETLARHLWMKAEDKRVPEGWEYIGQETRDQYRDRARINLAAKRDADAAKMIAQGRVRQTDWSTDVARDRLIAAMLGIDFDGVWVLDENIQMRGAARKAMGAAAERLLDWIEKGGILAIPVIGQLAKDYDRERAAASELRQKVESLAQERDAIRERLAESERRRQGLFGELGNLREETGAELDRLRTEISALTTQRDDAYAVSHAQAGEIGQLNRELDEAVAARNEAVAKKNRLVLDFGAILGELTNWRTELQALESGPDWINIYANKIISKITGILGDGETVPIAEPESEEDILTWARRFADGGQP